MAILLLNDAQVRISLQLQLSIAIRPFLIGVFILTVGEGNGCVGYVRHAQVIHRQVEIPVGEYLRGKVKVGLKGQIET